MSARHAALAVLLAAACATAAGRWRETRRVDDRPLPPTALADGGREPATMPAAGPDAEPLERRMALAHRARGRGRPAATAMVRGRLGAGQEQGFTVRLEAGVCYSLLAVSEDEDEDVDLLLLDAEGSELAEDRRHDSVALVEICPDRDALYRAVVRMYGSPGGFALQLFGS